MKKPIFILGLSIAFLCILQLAVIPTAIGSLQVKDDYDAVFEYNVTDTNSSAIYQWYIPPDFSEHIDYEVNLNDNILVDVKDLTNPNSTIDLEIGNLTREGIVDQNAEGALSLGYYAVQYVLGFVGSTEWMETNSSLSDVSFLSYNFTLNDTYEFNNTSYDAVSFQFSDGFQTTSLTYDKQNGFLVYAHTVVGNYILGFELSNKLVKTAEPVNDYAGINFVTILGSLIVARFLVLRRTDSH